MGKDNECFSNLIVATTGEDQVFTYANMAENAGGKFIIKSPK